ncbi:DNA-binding protein WhiA [Desulfotomaculum copahuensis]|uniref:Probable cell division protein WhiA n=1 Tax=Desulfotomaculum copahuensis TaxID=1838280 RepID=A0A1B7LBX6_9FIRM|nr:DNA-binding protein WhiA [Desulfotomaculum copahuensis]OAT80222.1 DNA-binding protein WhiA [Desulfotomaculum copahuensis]
MSFSAVTKNELARLVGERECCRLAELAALVKMDGSLQISGRHQLALAVVTENAAVARKIFSLLKQLFGVQAEVLVQRKMRLRKNNVYLVRVPPGAGTGEILRRLGMVDGRDNLCPGIKQELIHRECCRRAYLRGVFLGGGSVNNPEGTYHLEIITNNRHHARDICRLMCREGMSARVSARKNWFVVYLKDSAQIVDCLNIMGAHTALLDFENVRVYKDVRNQVNRLVNCETANLNKTVDAAMQQVENIRLIAGTMGLDRLSPGLRQVAEARLQHPDASLRELGELLQPRVGKSGVNHRMRKLAEIAARLQNKDQTGPERAGDAPV